ncbi:MAG: FxsA family protein [Candidatus Riflebacteria bacterium]|nr:FxsA family protein [Candidatus Riflebacteria bacterium]
MGCIFHFFLIVTFFSISEVYLLLFVAQNTSLLFTMACCAFTGVVGGYFVRQQGLITLSKIKQTIESGVLPADEAIEALLLLIVGILLCVPGFITDFMGFLIIIPGIRNMVAKRLVKSFKAEIGSGRFKVYTAGTSPENSNKDHSAEERVLADDEIENATIISKTENDDDK